MGTPEGGQASALGAAGVDQLADVILAESRRAGLGPGSRLPTERRLAVDLGATRSSVRHALAVLEAEGRISREVGRGTFLRVAPTPRPDGGTAGEPRAIDGAARDGGARQGTAVLPGADGAAVSMGLAGAGPEDAGGFAPADVMTIRRLLEPLAMPLVVAWATASDFKEMDRCLAGGEQAASFEEFETWDLALHRAIITASHSPLLSRLNAVIETARHGRFWGDLKRRSTSRERRDVYQAEHRELVAALRARDADRAVEAMRAHLARVTGHLFAETR